MNTSINYDAVISICDELTKIVKELNNQFNRIQDISKNGNSVWKGTAANKYYEGLQKKYLNYLEVTESEMVKYIQEIKNLIERNKMTDSEINAEEITKINNAMPSIIGTIFSSGVQSLNKTEVKANDNIQSTTTETDAKSMDQKTIDDLKTNDNVNGSSYDDNEDFSFETPKNLNNESNVSSPNTTQNVGVGLGAVSLEDLVKSLNN